MWADLQRASAERQLVEWDHRTLRWVLPSSSPNKWSCLWRSQQKGCSVYLATGRVSPDHARLQLPGLIVMSSVVPIRPGLIVVLLWHRSLNSLRAAPETGRKTVHW